METRFKRRCWLLPLLLLAPLPAMARDFPGMLTVFVGLPLLVVAAAVMALLLVFRRHGWARGMGILVGLPVLLTGVYVACVDTWRFWPSLESGELGFRLVVILGCAALWACVLAITWRLWRGAPRAASSLH